MDSFVFRQNKEKKKKKKMAKRLSKEQKKKKKKKKKKITYSISTAHKCMQSVVLHLLCINIFISKNYFMKLSAKVIAILFFFF